PPRLASRPTRNSGPGGLQTSEAIRWVRVPCADGANVVARSSLRISLVDERAARLRRVALSVERKHVLRGGRARPDRRFVEVEDLLRRIGQHRVGTGD